MNELSNCFDRIYTNGLWGQPLCSGPGSWHQPLVDAYIDTVVNFLDSESLSGKCKAIDIGCGDFNIGSRIAPNCRSVEAIDVSQQIIDHCRRSYFDDKVTFTCADARTFVPEICDLIFVRQVFQHLSNKDIQQILSNISGASRYVMITEHIPSGNFQANLDIESGTPHTRLTQGSGVDITQKPFIHKLALYKDTLNYFGFGGNIRTCVYKGDLS